jgi:hypothetical protein
MIAALAVGAADPAQAYDITTHHYDTGRTGWNRFETILTPTSVASGSFGLLSSVTLDEQVDAQPLVVLHQVITGRGSHDVVYVATENDTIYAIDAKSGAILLERNFGPPATQAEIGGCSNNSTVIGIGSTPVIDVAAGRLYVVMANAEAGKPVFTIHALALADLTDEIPPVAVSASHTLSDGSTYSFNPAVTRQRPALLLAKGNVYAGFGSYCDQKASITRGWLLGWNATTLAPLAGNDLIDSAVLASPPAPIYLSSIWMSGYGPAADGAGAIYLVSANTATQLGNSSNRGQSALRVSGDLTKVLTYFTPYNASKMEDDDFGAGGIMLLPTQPGGLHLAVAAGKNGNMFLMDAFNMGGYHPDPGGKNDVLDRKRIGGCWCGESYFTGADGLNRIVSSGSQSLPGGANTEHLMTWKVVTGGKGPHLEEDMDIALSDSVQDPGFQTSVSSYGNVDGIIWAVGRPDGTTTQSGTGWPALLLYAIDANSGAILVDGVVGGGWLHLTGNANTVPVVTDGRVYVASYKQLSIFGLGATPATTFAPVSSAADPQAEGNLITGTVVRLDGARVVLRTRDGRAVTIDAAEAIRNQRAEMTGVALTALGRRDGAGVFHATSISRAKDSPAAWDPDR